MILSCLQTNRWTIMLKSAVTSKFHVSVSRFTLHVPNDSDKTNKSETCHFRMHYSATVNQQKEQSNLRNPYTRIIPPFTHSWTENLFVLSLHFHSFVPDIRHCVPVSCIQPRYSCPIDQDFPLKIAHCRSNVPRFTDQPSRDFFPVDSRATTFPKTNVISEPSVCRSMDSHSRRRFTASTSTSSCGRTSIQM